MKILLARCLRLQACGFSPHCVCDVDPTDPEDVAEWRVMIDPTARGDMIADKVRIWYEANRESWWDRHKPGIWGRAPDRDGSHADEFMLRLINAVHRAEQETPK